ncbi:MAG: response regulator [Alteromonas macleodii]|nr:response regulator [Alteromonas macleodii]
MKHQTIDWAALRILTLDDDFEFRAMVSGILRKLGVASTPIAKNFEEAFWEIENTRVDVVIVNHEIKGGMGITFAKQMRHPKDTPDPHRPIIMIAKKNDQSTLALAIQEGIDYLLIRPVTGADISETITNLLTKPPSRIITATYVGPCRRRLPKHFYKHYQGKERRQSPRGSNKENTQIRGL